MSHPHRSVGKGNCYLCVWLKRLETLSDEEVSAAEAQAEALAIEIAEEEKEYGDVLDASLNRVAQGEPTSTTPAATPTAAPAQASTSAQAGVCGTDSHVPTAEGPGTTNMQDALKKAMFQARNTRIDTTDPKLKHMLADCPVARDTTDERILSLIKAIKEWVADKVKTKRQKQRAKQQEKKAEARLKGSHLNKCTKNQVSINSCWSQRHLFHPADRLHC